jgi:hypothetical protein
LKLAQLALSLIGLAAIILAYVTGKVEFLIIALVAFVGGLYYMGAIGRRSNTENQTTEKKSAKDKSQNQQ